MSGREAHAWEGEHERLRVDLGAYVLGGLPDHDVAAVEAHLATCATCRAERDELLPAASVLGTLKSGAPRSSLAPSAAGAPAGLGTLVLDRVEQERGRERRTAWVRRAGLAAVAGAAAAAVLVVGLAVTSDDDEPSVPLEAVPVTVRETGVEADADLVNHTWGVEVKLTGTGFDPGGRYLVTVLGSDGTRYPAGEFVGTGPTQMHCNLSSSVLRDDATGFEVRDEAGDLVARSRFA